MCANPIGPLTDYHNLHTFMTSAARTPAADFDTQHERFRTAFQVLEKAIRDRAFPGASIASRTAATGGARCFRTLHLRIVVS